VTDNNLLSRADVAAITGIGDDVLHFWLRHGLIVSEPAEPRKHRRFEPSEARIAAVLAQLRGFGTNVTMLAAISKELRNGVTIARASGLELGEVQYCEEDGFLRDWEIYLETLEYQHEKDSAWLGYGLMAGEGLFRLYQSTDECWIFDDAQVGERLPCKAAIFFDFWQIFDNVRDDLRDLHR